jgi:hypothetical protein
MSREVQPRITECFGYVRVDFGNGNCAETSATYRSFSDLCIERPVSRALLEAASNGLCRQHCCGERGEDERRWLAPLEARVGDGRSPADDALDAFRRGGRALAAFLRGA